MFGRLNSAHVDCRPTGDHTVLSTRLRIVVARWSDVVVSMRLNRDTEAQHWLGWDPAEALGRAPLILDDPLQLSADVLAFVGFDRSTDQLVAAVGLNHGGDDYFDVGGVVDPQLRGQHLGREALTAVCGVAHRHFGIARLRAACETTNVASQRWLAASGFVRTEGPQQHVLPNGRTVECLWWHRVDLSARRRCRRARRP